MAEAAGLKSISLRPPGAPERKFHYRDTRADGAVIAQIFRAQDYSFRRLRRESELAALYETLVQEARQPLILDLGANIGASAVYFAMRFPRAHIVALEPESGNFDLLLANTRGLDIDVRRAAIGARDGEASIVDPGEGEWGYRTEAAGAGPRVPVQAAAGLVQEKRAAGFAPFIAKIDVEGTEGELFSDGAAWADGFPLVIVELHDWLLPRAGTARSFLRWAAERDRDFVLRAENVFSIANR